MAFFWVWCSHTVTCVSSYHICMPVQIKATAILYQTSRRWQLSNFVLKRLHHKTIIFLIHAILKVCGMNQRALMGNTLSTRCRLFISQPGLNYITSMGVCNHISKSCHFSVTSNSFTSVVHQAGKWSMSKEMASSAVVICIHLFGEHILFIQAREIGTNLLLIKSVASGCRHITEALHWSRAQKSFLKHVKATGFCRRGHIYQSFQFMASEEFARIKLNNHHSWTSAS